MRIIITILLLIAFLSNSKAQNSTSIDSLKYKTVKTQADSMGQCMIDKNYKLLLNYTHPLLIKMVGGKDKMLEYLNGQMSEMEKQGYSFSKVVIGNPSKFIDTLNELQCTISETITMKVSDGTHNGKLVSTGVLICISKDGGKKWYFIDANKDFATLKKIIPTLSSKIEVPEKSEPLFYPD